MAAPKKITRAWLYKTRDEGKIFIVGSKEYRKALRAGWTGDLTELREKMEKKARKQKPEIIVDLNTPPVEEAFDDPAYTK